MGEGGKAGVKKSIFWDFLLKIVFLKFGIGAGDHNNDNKSKHNHGKNNYNKDKNYKDKHGKDNHNKGNKNNPNKNNHNTNECFPVYP